MFVHMFGERYVQVYQKQIQFATPLSHFFELCVYDPIGGVTNPQRPVNTDFLLYT